MQIFPPQLVSSSPCDMAEWGGGKRRVPLARTARLQHTAQAALSDPAGRSLRNEDSGPTHLPSSNHFQASEPKQKTEGKATTEQRRQSAPGSTAGGEGREGDDAPASSQELVWVSSILITDEVFVVTAMAQERWGSG